MRTLTNKGVGRKRNRHIPRKNKDRHKLNQRVGQRKAEKSSKICGFLPQKYIGLRRCNIFIHYPTIGSGKLAKTRKKNKKIKKR